MSGGIFLVQGDRLVEMTEQGYASEDRLQALIARFPSILAGDLGNTPRRWLLIEREMGLDSEDDAALVTLPRDDDPFVIEFIQRLPAVRAGEPEPAVRRQVERIRKEIVERSNEEILAGKGAMTLFRELGSDQNIVSYAFNFLVDGRRNQNVTLLNKLNGAIFPQLSLGRDPGHIPDTKMFVTSSSADPAVYGERIVDDLRRRLGVTGSPDMPISFLISTTMDPWLTDTADGNFIPTLMQVMRAAVLEAVEQVRPADGGGT